MYLVDTNVWLEPLLSQERAEEAIRFLRGVPSDQMFMTDFTLHSICLALTRLGQFAGLTKFVNDTFLNGSVHLVRLLPSELQGVVATMTAFNLDFDDAYQYVAAEKLGLTIVSFDSHFDRTERGRKTPGEIISTSK